jgi:hypothetical protein|tara:strand:- start:5269 stop:5964 length:696 start_codon:yes stop_codon:yes gene_type:complete
MPRKFKVDQIYYNNWNGNIAPGHEDYFSKVSLIAEWIGYALESSLSGWHDGWNHFATITVQQTKEKFGDCRVYCSMATYELVEKLWKEDVADIKKKNDLYHRWVAGDLDEENHKAVTPHILSSFSGSVYPLDELTSEEFAKSCAKSDADHYRLTYQQAFMLWPEYENAIWAGADYPDLLFNDIEELNETFDERIKDINNNQYMNDEAKEDEGKKIEESREESKILCGFKAE